MFSRPIGVGCNGCLGGGCSLTFGFSGKGCCYSRLICSVCLARFGAGLTRPGRVGSCFVTNVSSVVTGHGVNGRRCTMTPSSLLQGLHGGGGAVGWLVVGSVGVNGTRVLAYPRYNNVGRMVSLVSKGAFRYGY